MAEPSITCLIPRNSYSTQQLPPSLSFFSGFSTSTENFVFPGTGTNVTRLRGNSGFATKHPQNLPVSVKNAVIEHAARLGNAQTSQSNARPSGRERCPRKSQYYGFGMKIAAYSSAGHNRGFLSSRFSVPKATRGPPGYTSNPGSAGLTRGGNSRRLARVYFCKAPEPAISRLI